MSAEQLIRSKRVPTTSSVVISSQTNKDVSFDSSIRTELLYLHSKSPNEDTLSVQNSPVKDIKLSECKNEEGQMIAKNIVGTKLYDLLFT